MLTIDFDSKGLAEAFKRYAEVNRRDASELLKHQANALVNSLGAKGPKGLFREALDEKANVQSAIMAAAKAGPLRRPKGRSWAAELAKRLRYAAIIQAAGWLTHRYGAPSRVTGVRRVYSIANPPGQVRERLEGDEPFIEITNTQPRALEFAQATGYVDRAVKNREADMLDYVARKTGQRAEEF
jgi:hypothetical protein